MSTPDQLLESALHTEAVRLALEGGRIDEAVEALRELAGGSEDLVAEAAGILGGAWTVRAEIEEGWAPIAAGLLILDDPDRPPVRCYPECTHRPTWARSFGTSVSAADGVNHSGDHLTLPLAER
jgi:hypothetical protein